MYSTVIPRVYRCDPLLNQTQILSPPAKILNQLVFALQFFLAARAAGPRMLSISSILHGGSGSVQRPRDFWVACLVSGAAALFRLHPCGPGALQAQAACSAVQPCGGAPAADLARPPRAPRLF